MWGGGGGGHYYGNFTIFDVRSPLTDLILLNQVKVAKPLALKASVFFFLVSPARKKRGAMLQQATKPLASTHYERAVLLSRVSKFLFYTPKVCHRL